MFLISSMGYASSESSTSISNPPQFSGDIRQRVESAVNESPAAGKAETYDHLRLRARLNMKFQPAEKILTEIRLTTGNGAVSTNQSYGDSSKGMRNYDFKLDRAYGKWNFISGANLIFGKMSNPYYTHGPSDILFDHDLNMDGSALNYSYKSDSNEVLLTLGQFIHEEAKDTLANKDARQTSIQLVDKLKVNEELTLGFSLGSHKFMDMKDHAAVVTGNFYGNSNDGTNYLYNYDVQSAGFDLKYQWTVPVTFYTEFAKNSAADKDNTALIYGLSFNQLKKAKDWSFQIDHREVAKDATLGIITDDDSSGGGTNVRSVRTSFGYMIEDNLNFSITSYNGVKNIASGETAAKRERLHVDLSFKF